jgi:hypothetical protein
VWPYLLLKWLKETSSSILPPPAYNDRLRIGSVQREKLLLLPDLRRYPDLGSLRPTIDTEAPYAEPTAEAVVVLCFPCNPEPLCVRQNLRTLLVPRPLFRDLDLFPEGVWQRVLSTGCHFHETTIDPTPVSILLIARPDDESLSPDSADDRGLPLVMLCIVVDLERTDDLPPWPKESAVDTIEATIQTVGLPDYEIGTSDPSYSRSQLKRLACRAEKDWLFGSSGPYEPGIDGRGSIGCARIAPDFQRGRPACDSRVVTPSLRCGRRGARARFLELQQPVATWIGPRATDDTPGPREGELGSGGSTALSIPDYRAVDRIYPGGTPSSTGLGWAAQTRELAGVNFYINT